MLRVARRDVRPRAACVAALAVASMLSACSSVFPTPSGVHRAESPQVIRQQVAGHPGRQQPADRERVEVWLVAGNLHTGLVVPLAWLEEGGFRVPPSVRGAEWVNLSWGDRVAYEQERWLTPGEVLHALVLPSESVMEIIAVDYDPRWVFPDQRLYRGSVERGQGAELAAFLNHCMQTGADGSPELASIGEATWGRGQLLACPHEYRFPRLCNAWTAGALESCGYSFGPWSRIWANATIRRCRRQGFREVAPLSPAERAHLADYLRATSGERIDD